MRKPPILLALLICFTLEAIAQEKKQENLSSGVLMLNHSLKISNRYQLKSSIEQRIPFIFTDVPFFTGKVRARTDFTSGLQRKLNSSFTAAVGGMYRFINSTTEQRLYQQIGHIQQTLSRVKIAHRVRVDQTFSADATEFRYRYRIGAELPRSGFRTDPREHYFAVLAEYLVKFQDSVYTPEVRLASQFGFLFRNNNKGEVLLEIRIDELGSGSENLFLLGLSYYLSK